MDTASDPVGSMRAPWREGARIAHLYPPRTPRAGFRFSGDRAVAMGFI